MRCMVLLLYSQDNFISSTVCGVFCAVLDEDLERAVLTIREAAEDEDERVMTFNKSNKLYSIFHNIYMTLLTI